MAVKDTTLEVLESLIDAGGNAEKTASEAQEQARAVAEAQAKEVAVDPVELQENVTPKVPMEYLGSYEGKDVSSANIFGSEGNNLSMKPQMTPDYARRLGYTARFFKDLAEGRRNFKQLKEAMNSSDFSALMGDTLDRILLVKWAVYQPSYRQFMRRRTAKDFRAIGAVRRAGGTRLSAVPEGGTYTQASMSESDYEFRVQKYGLTYALTWEMEVNDDLEAFTDLPDAMAEDAIQTEMYLASALYVANTTLFKNNHSHNGSTYSNIGTYVLNAANLEIVYNRMTTFPGDKDKPLLNTPAFLVTGPTLKFTAKRILGSTVIQWSGGDATSGADAVGNSTMNVLQGELVHIVDPYMPVLDPTNGLTSWYLFSGPSMMAALDYAYLRGYETPQIFQKVATQQRMGGGGGRDGDWNDDSTGYKSRHVFGGADTSAAGGWRGCFWSNGTGA